MPETFGERLRILLQQQRLSQQDVADALDIPRNTVWRWVNNKSTPESNKLQSLATLLHVSVDDLFNGSPPKKSGDWVITLKVADRFTKEEINLTGNIQPIAQITATPQGCAFMIQADWEMLKTKSGLEKLFKRIAKETYPAMRGTGIALGGLPQE